MDKSNNEVSQNNVKLLAYQKSNTKDTAPLATTDEEPPPTPPPPLPPPPLSMCPPPRPTETHPLNNPSNPEESSQEEQSEHATLNTKTNDDTSLVKDSSRPKPVRGTTHLFSSLYAKLIVAATAVLVTTEILPNSVPLFYYHGYLFTFLIGVGILCILCIYMSVMLQKCPGLDELEELDQNTPESESVLRRKAYAVPEISIFFRVGALVFGLGTLIAIGLETATLFSMEKLCNNMSKLDLVQPVMHALFTFMQMHFLSLNSQKAIRNLGWCRHLVLMHLVATNIAVWLRLIVWETARSWLDVSHINLNITEYPPDRINMTAHAIFTDGRHEVYVSPNCRWLVHDEKMEPILDLRQCYRNTTIGIIWEKAQPFIVPFIVQYCLVGAVVSYTLWESFSNYRRRPRRGNSWSPRAHDLELRVVTSHQARKVDCKGSSKGLFLGLLVLAVGIVVLILFFVLTNNPNLKDETLFIMITVHCGFLGLSFLAILLGICRVSCMCTDYSRRLDLHAVLQNLGVFAVYVHGTCSLVVGITNIMIPEYLAVFVDGSLMIVQSLAQSILFHKVGQKCCSAKCKHEGSRPGRQIVTFLAFTNLVLWVTESFTDHNHVSSQLQLQFFGIIPWGLISRIMLPLVMFYRFHSSVYLMEAWKSGYSMDK